MKKKLETLLFKTLLVIIPLTLLTFAWSFAVHASASYLYHTYTAPLLTNGVLVTHSQKQLTTKPLQIEYSVLKVPAVKTTGVKK